MAALSCNLDRTKSSDMAILTYDLDQFQTLGMAVLKSFIYLT